MRVMSDKPYVTRNAGTSSIKPFAELKPYINYSNIYVPFFYQEKSYSCGEAALRMLFAYYGLNVSEEEIGAVANWDPDYGTYNTDLLRAAHFSILSTAIQNKSMRGYSGRKIGFPAFQCWGLTIDDLKQLIDKGFPVLILARYKQGGYGHFRVVKGYDDKRKVFIIHDPWYFPAPYAGPNVLISYDTLCKLWEYSYYWGMIITPWIVDFNIANFGPNKIFTVMLNITYHVPEPFNPSDYPAINATLNISVPEDYVLLTSNSIIFDDCFEGGESHIIEFQVQAPDTIDEKDYIEILAYGKIFGYSFSYDYYEDYVGTIIKIALMDYIKPEIHYIDYKLSENPGRLNVTVQYYDEHNVSIVIFYNEINVNAPYYILVANVSNNIATTVISLERGDISVELCVRITDEYGNVVYSTSFLFYIEDDEPYIKLETNKLVITEQVQEVRISWIIYDDFGIMAIKIYVNDTLRQVFYEGTTYFDLHVSQGYYVIKVEAIDTAWQSSVSKMILLVDFIPPVIETNINNGSITTEYLHISVNVHDNIKLKEVRVYLDGECIKVSNGSIEFSKFVLFGGHELKIIATDEADNVSILVCRMTCLPIIIASILLVIVLTLILLRRKKRRN